MKKENLPIIITSIIAIVVLIVSTMFLFVFSDPTRSSNIITVQGVSTVKAMPDLITIHFSINTDGKTSADAGNENSAIYDRLVEELTESGVSFESIKTENYNIYPKYSWNNGNQKLEGYSAHRSVYIETSANESEFLTEIIDVGINAGAGISYINFELSQNLQNAYKSQALKLAAEDAKIKAQSLAAGFGKSIGRLISVSTSDFEYYPWRVYSANLEVGSDSQEVGLAKEAVANINPSEREITATLSAIFRMR